MIGYGVPNGLMLLLALAIDQLGEPPNAVHPVVWIGNTIGLLTRPRLWSRFPNWLQFTYGVAVSIVIVGAFSAASFFLLRWIAGLNTVAYVIVGAVLLKTTFSLRGLHMAAVRVRDLLSHGKLPEARSAVRALVGRDTASLDEGQVVSATVESVAENTCDSFVAPVLFFALLGVPGALAYRAINTLDNSIGFRGAYEYVGKCAARLDDVVNFIPARISALLIVFSTWISGRDGTRAWHIMIRDRKNTPSPNGGWTMGAMAGALDVQLEKPKYYKLGDARTALDVSVIGGSLGLLSAAAGAWAVLAIVAQGVIALG